MKIKDSFEGIFSKLNKVLVVLAHPDDIEINCGGLVSRLTSSGKSVRLVVTTNGGRGMKNKKGINEKDFGRERVEEQMKSGEILGVPRRENFNLQIPDGELETTIENIEKVVFHIRQFKPDLVITHNPEDFFIDFNNKSTWVNHRDHRNTGQITIDAIYPYSRNRGFFLEHFEKHNLEVHELTKLLITDSYTKKAVRYFAIDNYLEPKKKALQQHISAFDPSEAGDYVEENKYEDGYFEPFGYYEIY